MQKIKSQNEIAKQTNTNDTYYIIEDFVSELESDYILDLGCGSGYSTYTIDDLGFSVVGIDYSQEMIDFAQKQRPHAAPVEFIKADIRNIAQLFSENHFGGVFAQEALQDLTRQEMETTLTNINHLTKAGGRVYISINIEIGSQNNYAVFSNFANWHKDEFELLALSCGLEIEKVRVERIAASGSDIFHYYFINFKINQ